MTLVWSDDWTVQRNSYADLLNRVDDMRMRYEPATYIDSLPPGTNDSVYNDISSAWSLKEGGTLTPPGVSKTQWYDPSTAIIESVFIQDGLIGSFPESLVGIAYDTNEVELFDVKYLEEADADPDTYTATLTGQFDSLHFISRVMGSTDDTALYVRPDSNSALNSDSIIADVAYNALTWAEVTSTADGALFATRTQVPGLTTNLKHAYGAMYMEMFFPFEGAFMQALIHQAIIQPPIAAAGGARITMGGATKAEALDTNMQWQVNVGTHYRGSWHIAYGIRRTL